MFKEFKEFALKGNAMDMAIGIIIGGAFGKIISSLVTDIIMPPVGWLTGGVDFASLVITLKESVGTEPAVTINYGLFINTLIDFVIIAFSIFIVIRQMNKLTKKNEKKAEVKPVKPAEDILLLREIRDSLKK